MSRARLRSMSGFGAADRPAGAGLGIAVEIRSVNQRGLEVAVSLPEGLQAADPEVRERVGAALARGRVDVRVRLERAAARAAGGGPRLLDPGLAAAYARELMALARRLKLDPPRVEALASLPGVVGREPAPPEPRRLGPALRGALAAALDRLVAMRGREGAALARDVLARAAALERGAAEVARGWPVARRALEERQAGRVRELLERLGEGAKAGAIKELLGAADRGDVSEELTRLASHLEQLRATVAGGSPAGRKLEFLAQELHREVNTIGSKSQDAGITRVVVAMKEDVERIREQAANVE